jgi:chaperone required for assembly of F1-ATPase
VKRFWSEVSVSGTDGDYGVLLDGKPMRLPGGESLAFRSQSLAALIAQEWAAAGSLRGGEVTLADIPLTRLAASAQHGVAADPAPAIEAVARYAETDALCYRAKQPETLVVRQHHAFQPWLDWAAATYGARLITTQEVIHVAQPPEAVAALRRAVTALDASTLAALVVIVPALGSVVLGLAVAEGQLSAAQAYTISLIDELFQEEIFGADAEAAKRRNEVAHDLITAERFLRATA